MVKKLSCPYCFKELVNASFNNFTNSVLLVCWHCKKKIYVVKSDYLEYVYNIPKEDEHNLKEFIEDCENEQ
jgi:hypothetical protein